MHLKASVIFDRCQHEEEPKCDLSHPMGLLESTMETTFGLQPMITAQLLKPSRDLDPPASCQKLLKLSRSFTDDTPIPFLQMQAEPSAIDMTCCTQLTNDTLEQVAELFPHIVEIDVSHTVDLTALGGLLHLQVLKASHTNLPGMSFDAYTSLHTLDVSFCDQITDARFPTTLRKLNLSFCKYLTDAGLLHLPENLEELDLSATQITDATLQRLITCANLQKLRVDFCKVTDQGLAHTSALVHLQVFSIKYNNYITDCGVRHLIGLSELRTLRLESCGLLTNATIICLAQLPKLETVETLMCDRITQTINELRPKHEKLTFVRATDQDVRTTLRLNNRKSIRQVDLQGCNALTNEALV